MDSEERKLLVAILEQLQQANQTLRDIREELKAAREHGEIILGNPVPQDDAVKPNS